MLLPPVPSGPCCRAATGLLRWPPTPALPHCWRQVRAHLLSRAAATAGGTDGGVAALLQQTEVSPAELDKLLASPGVTSGERQAVQRALHCARSSQQIYELPPAAAAALHVAPAELEALHASASDGEAFWRGVRRLVWRPTPAAAHLLRKTAPSFADIAAKALQQAPQVGAAAGWPHALPLLLRW